MKNNSLEAFESIKDTRETMHRKIRAALSEMGKGTFRIIARKLQIRDDQVWRRLSEMERTGKIERCGNTIDSVTGRSVTLWKIVE